MSDSIKWQKYYEVMRITGIGGPSSCFWILLRAYDPSLHSFPFVVVFCLSLQYLEHHGIDPASLTHLLCFPHTNFDVWTVLESDGQSCSLRRAQSPHLISVGAVFGPFERSHVLRYPRLKARKISERWLAMNRTENSSRASWKYSSVSLAARTAQIRP